MQPSRDCLEVMGDLRRGDEAAAFEVHAHFVRRLVALAQRQFDTWIRQKADPEEAVQSALATFFDRYASGQFELREWEAVWRLLAVITVRKCRKRYERLLAEKRDASRELGWDGTRDPLDREPTPEEAAILSETVGTWLAGLPELERPVVELGLEGASDEEIARRLLRSERTVRRVRQQAEQRLQAYVERES